MQCNECNKPVHPDDGGEFFDPKTGDIHLHWYCWEKLATRTSRTCHSCGVDLPAGTLSYQTLCSECRDY